MRGERKSRSAISRLVRPSLARRTIWRCCGVSSPRTSGWPGVPATATPQALSSASARCAHDRAPSRRKVPRASVSTGLASLIRRRRRSHSPWSRRSCARSNGHCSPAGSASAVLETGLGLARTGEEAAGPGDELLEPGRNRSVQTAERLLQDVLSFRPPVGADRGGGDIGHAQVGEDVVHRRAFRAEELAELGEGIEMAAVGQGRDAERPPGPGGYQPVFRWIDPGQGPVSVPCAPRRSRRAWPGRWPRSSRRPRRRFPSGWPPPARRPRRRLPGPRPSVRCRCTATRARSGPAPLVPRMPGARSRCMASCSMVIARPDSSRSHAAEPARHRAGSSSGEPAICAQVRDELASAAERVGAGPYPEPPARRHQCAGGRPRAAAPRCFQESEDAADGLAAGGRAGLIGDGGCIREGIPGQGGQVTRCLFGDGQERRRARRCAGPSRPAPIRRRGARSAAAPGPP